MSMLKDLTKITSNPIHLSSRAKTKGRKMLGMAVNTLFSQDLCCLDYRILIIAIQIKLHRGQLISRIHTKTTQKIFVGVGKKTKTFENVKL